MKTIDLVKFNKGYYLRTCYCGRTINNEYCKDEKTATARVNELKAEGWTLSV